MVAIFSRMQRLEVGLVQQMHPFLHWARLEDCLRFLVLKHEQFGRLEAGGIVEWHLPLVQSWERGAWWEVRREDELLPLTMAGGSCQFDFWSLHFSRKARQG